MKLALLVEDGIVQGRIAHSQGALYDDAFLGQPDASTAICLLATSSRCRCWQEAESESHEAVTSEHKKRKA